MLKWLRQLLGDFRFRCVSMKLYYAKCCNTLLLAVASSSPKTNLMVGLVIILPFRLLLELDLDFQVAESLEPKLRRKVRNASNQRTGCGK